MFSLKDLFNTLTGGGVASAAKDIPKRGTPRYGNSDIPNNQRSQMNDIRGFVRGNRRDPIGQFPRQPRYEDEGFVGSPRNLNQYSPMNADVKNYFDINPDLALRLQGGLRGLQGSSFDPMQSAARMQYGAQNQFYEGQNPMYRDDYRGLRVR